jgi:hypothetical protein
MRSTTTRTDNGRRQGRTTDDGEDGQRTTTKTDDENGARRPPSRSSYLDAPSFESHTNMHNSSTIHLIIICIDTLSKPTSIRRHIDDRRRGRRTTTRAVLRRRPPSSVVVALLISQYVVIRITYNHAQFIDNTFNHHLYRYASETDVDTTSYRRRTTEDDGGRRRTAVRRMPRHRPPPSSSVAVRRLSYERTSRCISAIDALFSCSSIVMSIACVFESLIVSRRRTRTARAG